jgi:hypothetical protein
MVKFVPEWILNALVDGEVINTEDRLNDQEKPDLGELPAWAEPLDEVDYGIVDDSQSIGGDVG